MKSLTRFLSVCEKMVVFSLGYSILKIWGEQELISFHHLVLRFWPMHVRKMEVFILLILLSFFASAKRKSKCLSQIFRPGGTLPLNEKALGGSSWSMIHWNIGTFSVYHYLLELNKLIDKRWLLNKLKYFFWYHDVFLVWYKETRSIKSTGVLL